MQRLINTVVLLFFVASLLPANALAFMKIDEASSFPLSVGLIRELSQAEMAQVRGGVSPPSSGGGKGGGGSQPIIQERLIVPAVPHIYQKITNFGSFNPRSNMYCGFAVSLMLRYWVQGHIPDRYWQTIDLEELDNKALAGGFGWPIDVVYNGGFMVYDPFLWGDSGDAELWRRSRIAASNLFKTNNGVGHLVLSVDASAESVASGLTSAWNQIHPFGDVDQTRRTPTIIVTKLSSSSLHYNLIMGTRKQGSQEQFYINDPWREFDGQQVYFERAEILNNMTITYGEQHYFDWVARVMDGRGIFGVITEHDYWR